MNLPDVFGVVPSVVRDIGALTPQDIASIGTLVLLEGLLSADNALVLALIARRLPDRKEQNRALTIGIALSFVFRAIGLLLASLIINLWYMRALGAAYLFYLAVTHFAEAARGKGRHNAEKSFEEVAREAAASDTAETQEATPEPPYPNSSGATTTSRRQFRNVVFALALTDIAFAIDSILVAVALTKNLAVIYLGVIIGIVALRFVATAFLRLLERFPALDHTAYALVAWAGVKLGLEAIESFGGTVLRQHWPVHLPKDVFWIGMAAIVLIGAYVAFRNPAQVPASESVARR